MNCLSFNVNLIVIAFFAMLLCPQKQVQQFQQVDLVKVEKTKIEIFQSAEEQDILHGELLYRY